MYDQWGQGCISCIAGIRLLTVTKQHLMDHVIFDGLTRCAQGKIWHSLTAM